MQLVIDASTLVSESLRVRGRELLANPFLDLVVAEEIWGEAEYEIERRSAMLVGRGRIPLTERSRIRNHVESTLNDRLTIASHRRYRNHLSEASWRIPRDPTDVPSVALALALECGIWTNDHDFFGCGLPVWVTETLRRYLAERGVFA